MEIVKVADDQESNDSTLNPEIPEAQCGNCKYRMQVSPHEIQCHFGAPVPMILYMRQPPMEPSHQMIAVAGKTIKGPEAEMPVFQLIAVWPLIKDSQWCGQHRWKKGDA